VVIFVLGILVRIWLWSRRARISWSRLVAFLPVVNIVYQCSNW